MINQKLTFETYIHFLLLKLVNSYNLKHYPPISRYELSNHWHKLVNNIEKDLNYNIELNNFIEYLKDFKSENFIKNHQLFDDIILYLESINTIKLTFKIFQKDVELLNNDETFKNTNLLKYYNKCQIYYKEYYKIDNYYDNLDKYLV
jgi:hypothetical protein